MKKYISILVATIFTTTIQVFAMMALPPGSYNSPTFAEKVVADIMIFSYLFILFSQLVFVGYLIRLLHRMYVSKTVLHTGFAKWLRTLFSVLYILSFFSISLLYLYTNFFNVLSRPMQ